MCTIRFTTIAFAILSGTCLFGAGCGGGTPADGNTAGTGGDGGDGAGGAAGAGGSAAGRGGNTSGTAGSTAGNGGSTAGAGGAPAGTPTIFFLDVGGAVMTAAAENPMPRELVASAGQGPDGIAVDLAAGHIFWTGMGNPSSDEPTMTPV